jgi:hypothetical protein
MATKKIAGRKRTGSTTRPKARSAKKANGPVPKAPAAKKSKPDVSKAKIVRLMRKFEQDAKQKPDFHMSVSDYLRLLQVKRDLEDQPANVEVTWVETPDEQPSGE